MLQMMTSTDPEAKATIDQTDRTNVEMFNRLLHGVAPEDIRTSVSVSTPP